MTPVELIAKVDFLKTLRMPHEYLWKEIGFLTNARYFGNEGQSTAGNIPHSEIYDTTLRTKGRMQANGLTSMLFPRDRDWMVIQPPWEMRKNRSAIKKYREAGEGILHFLRQSNFHYHNHGVILARSYQGTGAMGMEWITDDSGEEVMNFRRYHTMKYLIDHNTRGKVDCFACEYDWPAAKAADEWTLEALSPKLQAEAKKPDNAGKCHKFRLLIERRPSWEREGKTGNKAMPYRVMVIEDETKHVVLDSGMETFGIVASRYETYDGPWGYSPAWEILPDAYKANYAAKFMMVMGERAAVPPVMAPASMKEEGVGLGAAEVTYVSEQDPNNWPRELSGGGNYQVGMDVWNKLQDKIDEAFSGPLFNMFSRSTRDRTQIEVAAMQGELNAQVDPTITALNQDHTDPVLVWAFQTCAERGLIDLPAESLDQRTGRFIVPRFAYENLITMNDRKAKALQAMEMVGFMYQLAAGGAPIDVLKLDKVAERIWRDNGQDEDEVMSEEEFQKQQEAKAQAAQAAQGMEMAQQGARAAKDASGAGIDIKSMIPNQQ